MTMLCVGQEANAGVTLDPAACVAEVECAVLVKAIVAGDRQAGAGEQHVIGA